MRLAICFFGHLRTWNQTHESFFKNIIEINRKGNWQIDIFMHTWDEFEKAGFAWHNHLKALDGKKVLQNDIDEVLRIYKPKKFLIETLHQDRGSHISISKSQELARDYAKEQNITYDYTLMLRPDLYFHNPLNLNLYIKWYKTDEMVKYYPLPPKHIFTAHNIFGRMPVADPRYICEGDLLWFGNFNPLPLHACSSLCKEYMVIPINYKLHIDFFLQRVDFRVNSDYVGAITNTFTFATHFERFEKLKELEHFSGFVKFYTHKKMALLRKNTRAIRYPIKNIFKKICPIFR